jgi:hypothetical protein
VKIGITSKFSYDLSANGLAQNVILLYEILETIGMEPVFIDFSHCEDEEPVKHEFINGKRLISWPLFRESPTHLDALLCPAIACDTFIYDSAKEGNKNIKIASIHYGNNLMGILSEWFGGKPMTNDNIRATSENGFKPYDECWISEHYLFAKEYYEHSEECEVKVLPYVWNEKFIKDEESRRGMDLSYKPVIRPNIAVCEPNLNISKNFFIPLMSICHILNNNNRLFNEAYIYCSQGRVTGDNGKGIATHILNYTAVGDNPKRVFFEERDRFTNILQNDSAIILSFQHLNALNYIYLEALLYGHPLVHNSEFFKDYGYYYEGFNVIEAADQLEYATKNHANNLEEYMEHSKKILYKYSSENPENIENTKKLILNLLK